MDMRCIASLSLLLVLGTVGCSSDGGSREAAGGAGGAGGAAAGSAGSSFPAAGAAGAGANGGAVGQAGAPISNGGAVGQAGAAPVGTDPGAHVMSWVPTYYVNESKQRLSADFGGASMGDGLSYLGLQFWLADGASARLQASEENVNWFKDWGRQKGVKILLCVHNHVNDAWNWGEAQRSFKTNGAAFAQDLLSQVNSRGLDGIDLDLEGIVEATEDDRLQYLQLVKTLSAALKPAGKVLTVDSFHGQWNAPNWNWWPDLFPFVDGITSMGYEQSGMGVDYQTLVDKAAAAPEKLMIGVPGYKGTWLNHSVGEQLGWIVQQGKIGTSIWDASLQAAEWQQKSVWDQLKVIKAR